MSTIETVMLDGFTAHVAEAWSDGTLPLLLALCFVFLCAFLGALIGASRP